MLANVNIKGKFRGYLHLEANGQSPKKWSVVIGGNKQYSIFGYILSKFFSIIDLRSAFLILWKVSYFQSTFKFLFFAVSANCTLVGSVTANMANT